MDRTRHIRPPTRPLAIAFVIALGLTTQLAASHAAARGERVEVGGIGLAFDVPAGWTLSETLEDDAVGFTLESPEGGAVIVINASPIGPEVQREIAALGSDAVLDTWEGFVEEVPSARIERRFEATVAGATVGRIDYAGDGFAGAVTQLLGDGVLVTIVAIAPDAAATALLGTLDDVLTGLQLRAAGAAVGGNPLAAAASGNPLTSAAGGNPLASAAGNPLASAAGNPLTGGTPSTSVLGHDERGPVHVEPFTSLDVDAVFGGALDVGRSGAWTGTLTGAAYVLHNDGDPSAVRYYFASTLPGVPTPLSRAQVGVDVVVRSGGEFAAAGLLYDFDPARGTYLAFTLTEEGVAVLRNAGGGLELLVHEPNDAVIASGVNRIEVRPRGSDVAVFVNGRSTMTLQGTTSFEGGVGIVAIGAGTYSFSDLVVDAR